MDSVTGLGLRSLMLNKYLDFGTYLLRPPSVSHFQPQKALSTSQDHHHHIRLLVKYSTFALKAFKLGHCFEELCITALP